MTIPTYVSVVVRTYNESQHLGRLIEVLRSQDGLPATCEIIVVDSGSTDGTVRIARARHVTVIEIAKSDFDYSKALNLGIERSSGEIVVLLSAHAIPCSASWLSRMLSHFADEEVAGVYCRQVPWPGAYWREVVRLRRLFGTLPLTFRNNAEGKAVPFSNAASCIRRSVWERHPFCLPAAEDVELATWAVANGWTIIYEPEASVYHSHGETPRQGARRLIELEKAADMRGARHRRVPLTIRQAIGCIVRDAHDVWDYAGMNPRALKFLWDSVERSYWFVRDFRRVATSLQQRHEIRRQTPTKAQIDS